MKAPENGRRLTAREAAEMAADIQIISQLTAEQKGLLQKSQERAARNPRALRRMGLTSDRNKA